MGQLLKTPNSPDCGPLAYNRFNLKFWARARPAVFWPLICPIPARDVSDASVGEPSFPKISKREGTNTDIPPERG